MQEAEILKRKSHKNTPWSRYQQDLTQPEFKHDVAQENAVLHLQRLYDELTERSSRRIRVRDTIKRVFTGKKKPEQIQGLYFWGGVGRGKTYLVDTFYDALPFEQKWRVHFHRFMQRVHSELKALRGQDDPLKVIAKRLANEARVICFDEFFVQDIADAMILGTLLEELFHLGVVFVTTSNIVPEDLYKNGLQRARFLPAIALLKKHCVVVNVDSGVDYRLRGLESAEIYHCPLDDVADTQLIQYFNMFTEGSSHIKKPSTIEIQGRSIEARMTSRSVAFFHFFAICKTARSAFDYVELAERYHTVLISHVEQMNDLHNDAARRFIALVDEFYERKVNLILSAAVSLENLYIGNSLAFEFKRCLSRLQEMQSKEYLALAHLS